MLWLLSIRVDFNKITSSRKLGEWILMHLTQSAREVIKKSHLKSSTYDLLLIYVDKPTTLVWTNSNHPQFCDFRNSWGWAVWRMRTLPTWNLHGRRCGLGVGIGIRELFGSPQMVVAPFFFVNGRNPKVWNGEKSSKLKLLISSFLCLSWEHWHEFLSSFFRFLFSRICSTSRPHPKGWFQCCFIYLMLRFTSLVKAFWLFSSMNSFCNRIKGEHVIEWPFPNPTFSLRSPLWWCETCPTSTPSRCCHETQLLWKTLEFAGFGVTSLGIEMPQRMTCQVLTSFHFLRD